MTKEPIVSPFSSPAQDLMPFFRPRGVAVVGASRNPAKLSYAVLRNLATGAHRFPGQRNPRPALLPQPGRRARPA